MIGLGPVCVRWALALCAMALCACGQQALQSPLSGVPLDNSSAGLSWSIPDTRGVVRSNTDFRGRLLVVYFGFTSCPDACPAELAKMAAVQRQLGPAAARVQVAFVTVDPDRDTLERLAAYVAAFDTSFIGLRPEPGHVDELTKPFRAYHQRSGDGEFYTVDHSSLLYVIDCSGRQRIAFPPEQTVTQIATTLRKLAAESDCGRG
jgi:protein SCO1/2